MSFQQLWACWIQSLSPPQLRQLCLSLTDSSRQKACNWRRKVRHSGLLFSFLIWCFSFSIACFWPLPRASTLGGWSTWKKERKGGQESPSKTGARALEFPGVKACLVLEGIQSTPSETAPQEPWLALTLMGVNTPSLRLVAYAFLGS